VRKAIRDLLDKRKDDPLPDPPPVKAGKVKVLGRGRRGKRRLMVEGKLQCLVCERWLSTTQYFIHQDKRTKRLHHDSYCHECRRLSYIARNHAISVARYREILAEASGHCQICKQEVPLHLDHCHHTGKLRGLLCVRCNTALGNFLDDPQILRAAASYVERYRTLHATTAQTEQDIERERRMSRIRR
jgi:hypothetical protein